MAAAYLRLFAGERLQVSSAGTDPAASIHPLTVAVMAEDGIDLSGERPRDYRSWLTAGRVDYLIVVCDGAEKACPTAWPGVVNRLSWPFRDPAALTGSEEEVLAGFRRVRDEIKERTRRWLASLDETTSRPLRNRVS